jgi:hypothetical protein
VKTADTSGFQQDGGEAYHHPRAGYRDRHFRRKIPDLFRIFSQVDHTLCRSEGGLGIGLALVKQLIELHGGKVNATSEGLGKGSEFTIRLPAATRPDTRLLLMKATDEVKERARIVVVDDNVDSVKIMAMLLKLAGHTVMTAHNGPQAIEVAQVYRPQCNTARPRPSGNERL